MLLIVDLCIGSLNVAVITLFRGTPIALAAGSVELTVGSVVSDAVVNVHILFAAIALPARSFAPVVIVAVYLVLAANRVDVFVKEAVLSSGLNVTVPTTLLPAGFFTVNVTCTYS